MLDSTWSSRAFVGLDLVEPRCSELAIEGEGVRAECGDRPILVASTFCAFLRTYLEQPDRLLAGHSQPLLASVEAPCKTLAEHALGPVLDAFGGDALAATYALKFRVSRPVGHRRLPRSQRSKRALRRGRGSDRGEVPVHAAGHAAHLPGPGSSGRGGGPRHPEHLGPLDGAHAGALFDGASRGAAGGPRPCHPAGPTRGWWEKWWERGGEWWEGMKKGPRLSSRTLEFTWLCLSGRRDSNSRRQPWQDRNGPFRAVSARSN